MEGVNVLFPQFHQAREEMECRPCHCGLLAEIRGNGGSSVPVPLVGVSVQANIIDLAADVTVEQRYVNKEKDPIEALYVFPLDEGAAVCGFTAEVNDRVIQGVVREAEEAQKDYADAIKSGRSAALVDEKLADVFKAKVGNIPPGSGATVRLSYVTELKVESGEIRFYLPTTIAPRYVPASDGSLAAQDLASIRYTTDAPFKLECDIRVKTTSAVKEIRCPTHKITTASCQPLEHHVRFADQTSVMDRDLVLYIQVAEPHRPRLICEKCDDVGAALMLSIVPSFELAQQKSEFVFLVDRSGSMGGSGIEQARRALKLFLHSLPVDCYVNIVGFGFKFKPLFTSSQRYSELILTQTKGYVGKMDADLGGTEIYDPLEWIFQQPTVEGYFRQVFVLTDGEVSNADDVISLVYQNKYKARVFALGLGDSASHHLVEGIARAGNGTALFASIDERLEKKVLQQLRNSLQPAMTDVAVHWERVEKPSEQVAVETEKTLLGYGKPIGEQVETVKGAVRQAPSQCPPVFDGSHLAVYALLSDGELPSSVTLSATSPAGPLTVNLPLSQSHFEGGRIVHKLAAKKLIRELQDQERSNDNKQEIIQLGCKYGLASRYTSFVAVDPKEHRTLRDSWMVMKSRDVPNTLASRWGGISQAVDTVVADCALPANAKPASLSTRFPRFWRSTNSESDGGEYVHDEDDLTKLVCAQRFDGSFVESDMLAKLLKTTLKDVRRAGERAGYAESVWATALALALLSLTMSDHQESWALVATKAEIWLRAQLQADPDKAKHDAEVFLKTQLNV